MGDAFQAHARTLAAKKCVGLVYFAGHGLQLAWRNYLVPVDAEIGKIEDIANAVRGHRRLVRPDREVGQRHERDHPGRLPRESLQHRRFPARAGGPLPDGRAAGHAARLCDGARQRGQRRRRGQRPVHLEPAARDEGARCQDRGRLQARAPRRASRVQGARRSPGRAPRSRRTSTSCRPSSCASSRRRRKSGSSARNAPSSRVRSSPEARRAARGIPAPLPERALRGAGAASARYGPRRARREAGRGGLAEGESQHARDSPAPIRASGWATNTSIAP